MAPKRQRQRKRLPRNSAEGNESFKIFQSVEGPEDRATAHAQDLVEAKQGHASILDAVRALKLGSPSSPAPGTQGIDYAIRAPKLDFPSSPARGAQKADDVRLLKLFSQRTLTPGGQGSPEPRSRAPPVPLRRSKRLAQKFKEGKLYGALAPSPPDGTRVGHKRLSKTAARGLYWNGVGKARAAEMKIAQDLDAVADKLGDLWLSDVKHNEGQDASGIYSGKQAKSPHSNKERKPESPEEWWLQRRRIQRAKEMRTANRTAKQTTKQTTKQVKAQVKEHAGIVRRLDEEPKMEGMEMKYLTRKERGLLKARKEVEAAAAKRGLTYEEYVKKRNDKKERARALKDQPGEEKISRRKSKQRRRASDRAARKNNRAARETGVTATVAGPGTRVKKAGSNPKSTNPMAETDINMVSIPAEHGKRLARQYKRTIEPELNSTATPLPEMGRMRLPDLRNAAPAEQTCFETEHMDEDL